MLTLGELYHEFFPHKPYQGYAQLDSPVPLKDFMIFLLSQGYVFTDVYFNFGLGDPEQGKTRAPKNELVKLQETLTQPRKGGQNNFVITDYSDLVADLTFRKIEKIQWSGVDIGKNKGKVLIDPIAREHKGSKYRKITGFRIRIEWYIMEKHGVEEFKTWVIYLGTTPTDNITANRLNALIHLFIPPKFIINYCKGIVLKE
tara:strand:- start:818 stop:1420 length:603 start_codon:yes stop_codon:yes gene_type:complete